MRPKSWCYALAIFLTLSVSAMVRAQEGPTKGKLGYGFAPGLRAGKDFVAGQLIVGLKDGMSINSVARAATAVGGKVAKTIDGTAMLLDISFAVFESEN